MGGVARSCVQSMLKLVNCLIGMVGLAIITYSLWLIRAWQRNMPHCPHFLTTLAIIILHLTLYMVFVFLLFMLEAGVTADIFLNRDWEEDFPDHPTGRFDQFKEFVRSNFDICKWIGLSIACVQIMAIPLHLFSVLFLLNVRCLLLPGLSLLLAMILKALGPHPYYDSDDEYVPERVPLLKSAVLPPPYVVGNPVYGSKSDSWNIRINSKLGFYLWMDGSVETQ